MIATIRVAILITKLNRASISTLNFSIVVATGDVATGDVTAT